MKSLSTFSVDVGVSSAVEILSIGGVKINNPDVINNTTSNIDSHACELFLGII